MTEKNNFHISGRSLRMPGVKPSDFFLFKEEKEYFDFDMRELVTLGLRWIYAGWHSKEMREMILSLAATIRQEDLDIQQSPIVYERFKDIA